MAIDPKLRAAIDDMRRRDKEKREAKKRALALKKDEGVTWGPVDDGGEAARLVRGIWGEPWRVVDKEEIEAAKKAMMDSIKIQDGVKLGAPLPDPNEVKPDLIHYGVRVAPKGTQFTIESLRDNPTALMVLMTMITCIGHGCVVKATRQKVMEITGLSASSYTRAVNTLLAHGFLWPNMPRANTYQAGYVIPEEMPKNKNGCRYKVGPFIAFRGPKEFKDAEISRYNSYMHQRLSKRLTPEYDESADNLIFQEVPNAPTT